MGFFKSIKPEIKVISVKHEKRTFTESDDFSDFSYGTLGHQTSRNNTKTYTHNVTIVLLAKDGELTYKEFNGKWDLDEVKKWEEL
jgi:hypothetical protein